MTCIELVSLPLQYRSDGVWLWTKYRGTVLSLTIAPVIATMALGLTADIAAHSMSASSWNLLAVPPRDDPLITSLNGLKWAAGTRSAVAVLPPVDSNDWCSSPCVAVPYGSISSRCAPLS